MVLGRAKPTYLATLAMLSRSFDEPQPASAKDCYRC